MDLSLMLCCPKIYVKRIVGVDIERTLNSSGSQLTTGQL
jgi:hypothetical protein